MSAGWPALLGCFFGSGFAALLYQTAWTRLFGAVFGTSELAVATVLAAYMAGLAVGAAAAGRLVGRVRRPVLLYGLLELGIAAAALAVPAAIRAATRLEVALLGGRELPGDAGGLASAGFFLLCAFAILGLPTALMGATLPLLARHAVRSEGELGRRVGALYAVNTAGAIGGTLTAGFALLPALGLRGTVWVGVALNAAVFALAAALARREPPLAPAARAPAAPAPRARDAGRWILPAVALSGAVSFGYEVLWTRLLGHVLGGSVYAFATMLASVLLGIAAGGALAARRATTPAAAAGGFAAAQLGTAALAFAAFHALERVPALAAALGAGSRAGLAANALVSMAILVPPSLAIGATFPFAVRVLARGPDEAGPASARVYAWNTVGAIAGSVATGFAVLPALGFAGTLALAVGANLALAAGAATAARPPRPRLALAAGAAAAALVLLPPAEPWRLLRASPLGPPAAGPVAHYGVGRAATVLLLREGDGYTLRSNGLPEAAIPLRGARPNAEGLVGWLGALPALLRPETRSQLVVGLGGGVALEHVPPSVRHVDVIELEPEVVAANRRVAERRRRDPLADPRVRVRTNDARSALLLSERRYDAIVSQPSHPFSAGASHLYTREFFELVRERLAPGGVFVQWIGLRFVDAELLRGLLATLGAVFPHVEVYRPVPLGVLFAASEAPLDPVAGAARALAAAPEAFAEVGVVTPEDAAAMRALDAAGTRALAAGAPVFSDDRNGLATGSPQVLARPLGAAATALFAPHDPLVPPPPALDAPYLVRRLAAMGLGDRAAAVAASIPEPERRAAAAAALALARGEPGAARLWLETALRAAAPERGAAELALLLGRDGAAPGAAHPAAATEGAASDGTAPAALLRAAWSLEAEGRRAALADLDAGLAAIRAPSLLEPEAVRLRALWRIETGDAALAREARALVDALAPRFAPGWLLAQRAEAGLRAGEPAGALADWLAASRALPPAERAAVRARAAALAATLPDREEREAWQRAFTRLPSGR